jgi:hypothetical protein
MLKKSLKIGIVLFLIGNGLFAQWSGSTTTTGNTYRDGNVGIGTTTPTNNLHIFSQSGYQQKLHGAGWFSGLQLKADDATKQLGIIYGTDGTLPVNTNQLRFGRYGINGDSWGSDLEAFPVIFDMDAPTGSLQLTESGWVGFGTQNPADKVEVVGNLRLSNGTTDGARLVWRGGANGSQEYRARIAPEGFLAFFPGEGNPTTLTLTQDGNVGIGTTYPGAYKLAVEGTMAARSVKVTSTAFADYVFEPTYKLRPLSTVESYINENKHLPGMPSAKEVEKEGGFELAAMNVKLLEKIEELTLYVIEIKKENEQMKKDNQQMKKAINDLKRKKN